MLKTIFLLSALLFLAEARPQSSCKFCKKKKKQRTHLNLTITLKLCFLSLALVPWAAGVPAAGCPDSHYVNEANRCVPKDREPPLAGVFTRTEKLRYRSLPEWLDRGKQSIN